MDLLGEWLGKTVEQELREALIWKTLHGNHPPSRSRIENRNIEDDGKNLRIQSLKPRILQINKWLEFDADPKATLSDGFSQINVRFSTVATQYYEKEQKRPLTEGTLGGLLQLIDFEIVATHSGPRADRITLRVDKFKKLGSEGSGAFYQILPHGVNSREMVKEHLKQLTMLRDQEHPNSHSLPRSDHEIPWFGSQPGHTSSGENVQPVSQMFASQADLSKRPATGDSEVEIRSEAPRVSAVADGGGSKVSKLLSMNSASEFKIPKALNPSDFSKHFSREQAKPHQPILNGVKTPVSNAEALLSLLPARKAAPTPVIVSNSLLEFDETTSVPNNITQAPAQDAARTEGSRVSDTASIKQSTNTQTTTSIQSTAMIIAEPLVDVVAEVPAKRKLTPGPDQADVRRRISSRDVRITKDQQALLNDEDSWIPAEPGHRGPAANVPISILEAMNRDADLRALSSTSSRESVGKIVAAEQLMGSRRPSMQSTGNDGQVESESDIPMSSSQWPASPERNQLPPDSSAGTTNPDQSPQRRSAHTISGTKTRRSSHASVSSQVASSPRPSSEFSTKTSRLSKVSSVGPASPSLVSPSVISTSAGEEIQTFRCRVIGCGKIYMDAGALRHHSDLHHKNNGSAQIFKCPVGTCDRAYTSPGALKCHSDRRHNGKQLPISQIRREINGPQATSPFEPKDTETMVVVSTSHEPVISIFGQSLSTTSTARTDPFVLNDCPRTSEDSNSQELNAGESPKSHTKPAVDEDLPLSQPQPTLISRAQHFDHGSVSTQSRFTSPESEMETTVPLALHENSAIHVKSALQQLFPSTASEPDVPFTQVKRTPYVNGIAQEHPKQSSSIQTSPSKRQSSQPLHSSLPEDITHVSASLPSTLVRSSAEVTVPRTANNMAVNKTSKDDQILKAANKSATAGGTHVDVNLQNCTEASLGALEKCSTQANDTDPPARDSVISVQDTLLHSIEREINSSPSRNTDPKRRAADAAILYPNVVKRRKKFALPSKYSAEDIDDDRDLSEGARRYRQEFIQSRRISETSTPMQSPKAPFAAQLLQPSPIIPPAIAEDVRMGSSAKSPDETKATESLVVQTIIDLEELEVLPVDDDIGLVAEPAVSATPLGHFETGRLFPILEASSRPLEADGEGQMHSHEEADDDVQMSDADVQPTVAPVDKGLASSTVQDPSGFVHVRVNDTTPGSNSPQAAHALGNASELESQVLDREMLVQAIPIETDQEASNPQENERDEPNFDYQRLPRQKLYTDAHSGSVSQSSLIDKSNSGSTALVPPPMEIDGKKPVSHLQETHDVDAESKATTFQLDHSDECSAGQENAPSATSGPTTRSLTPGTKIASVGVSMLDSSTNNHLSKPAPMGHYEGETTPAPANIFEQFKAAYPVYPGDMKQFVAICRKIENLVKSNSMEHQSLWDDFIVRQKTEYPQYLHQCVEDAEDPLSYEDFYRSEIEDPIYRSRIVTRRNLNEALFLTKLASNRKMGHRHAGERKTIQAGTGDTTLPAGSETAAPTSAKTSEPRVTIDLTQEHQESDHPHLPKPAPAQLLTSSMRVARSLPWVASGSDSEAGLSSVIDAVMSSNAIPMGQRSDSSLPSESRSQLKETSFQPSTITSLASEDETTRTPQSHLSSNDRSRNANFRESKTAKYQAYDADIQSAWGVGADDILDKEYYDYISNRWVKQLADIAKTMELGEARKLLREQMHSRVRGNPSGARLKMINADVEAVRAIANERLVSNLFGATSALNIPKRLEYPAIASEAHDHLEDKPHEERIQMAWGVSADNIMDTKYYDTKTMTPRVLQILAEISSMTNIVEARHLIRTQIVTKGKARKAMTVTLADLKAIKDILHSRRPAVDGRQERGVRVETLRGEIAPDLSSLSQNDTAAEEQHKLAVKKWWQDEDSPYRTFERAYASIQPGKGNSYAKKGTDKSKKVKRVQSRMLDMLGWTL